MGTGLKMVGMVVLLLVTSRLASEAFVMLSAPSDLMVVGGVAILLGVVVFYAWLTRKFGVLAKIQTMMKTKLMVAVLLASVVPVALGCTRVGPGYAGIKVNYAGSDRGVEDTPQVTGWVFYNPFSATVLEWPTFVQTASWTRDKNEGSPNNEEISYNSSEGMVFTADISLGYRIAAEKVPAFYVKFRTDDLDKFTHGYLRNVARDAFNEVAAKYTADELYGAKKEDALNRAKELLNRHVEPFGIVIEQLGYIGAPRPPDAVVEAINRKIEAIQNAIAAENKVREAKASAQQQIAKAEGEAVANERLTRSLTENLIRWRSLEITRLAIERWDGKRPMVEGMAGGLLLNINPPQPPPAPAEKK